MKSSVSGIYGYSPRFSISGVAADAFEVDDSSAVASAIATDGTAQNRTIARNDTDWVAFEAQKDSLYVVRTAGAGSTTAYLFPRRDSTYAAVRSGNGMIFWKSTLTGRAYLKILPYSASYYGAYTLMVKKYAESAVVAFVNPTANSTFSAGNTYTVQWVADTALFGASVRRYLFRDQAQVENVTSSTTLNDGAQDWAVPSGMVSSNRYRIKMVSADVSLPAYAFSPHFTISGMAADSYEPDDSLSQAKTITADTAGQSRTLTRGDVDWIKLAAQGTMLYAMSLPCSLHTALRLYGADGVSILQTGSGSGAGSPAQIVWYCALAGTYYYSVSSSSPGPYRALLTAYDSTAYRFQVTAPPAGATVTTGASNTIRWESRVNVGGYVDIFLYNAGGVVETIAANTPNDGVFVWSVPTGTVSGSGYYIKIISRYSSSILGYSDTFSITAP